MYDYLDRNPHERLKFPSGNLWPLIYANKVNFDAQVLVLVVGTEGGTISNSFQEQHALINQLGERANIPVAVVAFDTDVRIIEEVQYSEGRNRLERISLLTLADRMKALGLSVNNTPTSKAINDEYSSAYHKWQRDNLGNDIVVVDIDMFKISSEGVIEKFYELKRSFKELNEWSPYQVDYNNFRVMSRLANKTNIGFDIVYNRRTKNPWFDDISNLSVFNVDFNRGTPINPVGRVDLETFMTN